MSLGSTVALPAQFTFFDCFGQDLGRGVHNLNADSIKAYVSNDAPLVATDVAKSDVVEISIANGYTGPVAITATYSQSSGTATFSGTGTTYTLTGAVGPWRYVVVYNDTPAAKPLIGYLDIGNAISQTNGETLTTNFSAFFTLKTR